MSIIATHLQYQWVSAVPRKTNMWKGLHGLILFLFVDRKDKKPFRRSESTQMQTFEVTVSQRPRGVSDLCVCCFPAWNTLETSRTSWDTCWSDPAALCSRARFPSQPWSFCTKHNLSSWVHKLQISLIFDWCIICWIKKPVLHTFLISYQCCPHLSGCKREKSYKYWYCFYASWHV